SNPDIAIWTLLAIISWKYIGFADGALRLVPPHWEVVWFGYTVSFNILAPIAVLVLLILAILLYPFIEGWVTGDKRE
ncbi:hypothetical protein IAE22_35920, partial [Bacillus sp. S34]|nr:hypothetical protein [Bacillus sp. S34]